MPVVEQELDVKAAPDVAWRRISDPQVFATIVPEMVRVEAVSGSGVGMRWRCEDERGQHWELQCSDWKPGESITLDQVSEGDGPYKSMSCRYAAVPATREGHTRLQVHCDYQPRLSVVGEVLDAAYGRSRLLAQVSALLENWAADVRQQVWGHKVTVQTILNEKGSHVFSVPPAETIGRTADLLAEKRIGAVLVIDAAGTLCGIVSERDIVRGLANDGAGALGLPVSGIMSSQLVVCSPGHDMEYVMACMSDRRIRHLPVLDDGKLAGIISIGDVVHQRIRMLESQSRNMREYIEAREWRYLHPDTGDLHGEH